MTKEEMGDVAYQNLINAILQIMIANGISNTTMDNLAAKLKMSKRTLYEIFTSKDMLVEEIIRAYNTNLEEKHKEIASISENEIEAILRIFLYSRDVLLETNMDFYNDMDMHFTKANMNSREEQFHYLHNMVDLIRQGMIKGLFREDINYLVHFRMMVLQMESLKRMEETFPKDITPLDVYDTVCISFLRGIVSDKGMVILDRLIMDHPELIHKLN